MHFKYFLLLDVSFNKEVMQVKLMRLPTFKFTEAATRRVVEKKTVLQNFAIFKGKHLCWSLFLIKKTPALIFSCQYSEKNNYFEKHLRMAASELKSIPVKIAVFSYQ